MPIRLAIASTITLSFLLAGIVLVLFTAAAIGGAPSWVLGVLMLLSVVFGFLMWAFGPWFNDLVLKWAYNVRFLEFHEFEREYPEIGGFMRSVCETESMPLPMMRIIEDDNPTAFTYGSLPSNARVALSRGLFRFCDNDEVCAVATHELGHIRHYDFAVMTVASVLLQLLYETYWWLARGTGDRDDRLKYVGFGAYVLWLVGTYVVLWLSRSREYMADAFAAEHMGDAAPLQRSLVRIAYGLAELQSTAEAAGQKQNMRLVESTRALGIADPKASVGVGNAVRMAGTQGSAVVDEQPWAQASTRTGGFRPELVEPVFLYDLFNPWAMISELSSTHPLTGKRLQALNEMAPSMGHQPLFRFDKVNQDGEELDTVKLYGDFSFEVFIYFLPVILPMFALLMAFVRPEVVPGLMVMAGGAGMFLRGLYRYGMLGAFEATTVYELMCDPYASPLRGRPVILKGEIIGKGDAGSKYREDLQMKDRSGALIYLNIERLVPFFGNLIFGASTATQAIGKQATARGWFRRGITQHVDLHSLEVGRETHDSYTRFWGISGGLVVMVLGVVVTLVLGLAGGPDVPEIERNAEGVQVW